FAAEGQKLLADTAVGREVTLYYDQRRNDRYGRVLAQVVAPSDLWLQAELVRRGLARVHTTADTAAPAAALLAMEAEARQGRRGLWTQMPYQARRPADLGRWIDSFQIVEGRIGDVRRAANQTWLVFADTRGRPVEIAIPSTARRNFRVADIDPAAL